MGALSGELRRQLERSIVAARDEAERAARAALETLGVKRREAYPGISDEDRQLRVQLRARARQLGEGDFEAGIKPLVEEIAYEGWHRMLFARFLAENKLLMHASGVAVTLEECAELTREEIEPDAWMVAARYAGAMLPGIFRQDDPSSRVRFAPEGRNALERILTDLPSAVFTADDALGWVYQFWQSKAKKAVNDSGVKIGAKELPAVTQLFTEDYMVRFLLENSLGAWWAVRHPESPLIKEWEYLRRSEDGKPVAGRFEGWPERAAQVTMMDPCCGSGHFLVAAFEMLRKMRMEEEGLSRWEAGDAVLRDNLHGLEIDPRCTQIAAFALAFAAWKSGAYRVLPPLNVACSGIPVKGQLTDWIRLAGEDVNLQLTLERLYQLFRDAPILGSLINPSVLRDPLFASDQDQVEVMLNRALDKEREEGDSVAEIFGATAEGMVRASRLLNRVYTIVATNVPYLARGRQDRTLQQFCNEYCSDAKTDLATALLHRCQTFVTSGGTCCVVSPQNWLYLGSYKSFRRHFLRCYCPHLLVRLGPGAFETISGEVVKPILVIFDNSFPADDNPITCSDLSNLEGASRKGAVLRTTPLIPITQSTQLRNPDAIISLQRPSEGRLLSAIAQSAHGVGTFDKARFIFQFWEVAELAPVWMLSQSTVERTDLYGGRQSALRWENGKGGLANYMLEMKSKGYTSGKWKAGHQIWGSTGVLISLMGGLPASLYTGQPFDENAAAIVPHDPSHVPALWAFCSSPKFTESVRNIDQSLKVTPATIVKVPFDLGHWEKFAEEAGPLPEPYSNDPTQWLFKGDPAESTEPLQAAVARLLGYHWPNQQRDRLANFADEDGIVPLVPVLNEQPAAERLRGLLVEAFGGTWSTNRQDALLSQVGYGGKDLSIWLRDGYFPRHAKTFHNRPFIWQIWDGTRDGFSVLVNYHKLDSSTLERLIYTYLGAWIDRQRGERDAGVASAEGRLVAALSLQKKLVAIREGEPPYDIYVRWKPLHEQPIGWYPDLNDGIRLNIRPFVTAGVLRSKFTINWNKDRGTNPDGSERLNDLHLTVAEKYVARAAAGVA